MQQLGKSGVECLERLGPEGPAVVNGLRQQPKRSTFARQC